jgi:O-acetyl-ADP-ribose deacetylase (regulator of RNase III)
MPTSFVKGDLFATEGIRAYAHGCNCAGAMDSGVAVAFKKRFPRMFEEYQLRCAEGRFKLGDVFVWNEGDEVVYNLGIQDNWKTRPKLAAFAKALRKTVELAGHARTERVGLPRIGAGVGGLDWPRVRKVLTEIGEETTVELVVFEQFVRAPSAATKEMPS